MTELASCRATDAQREEIGRLAALFQPDLEIDEFRRLDKLFHAAIASACGNPMLAEVYQKVLLALFESTEFSSLLYADANAKEVAEIVATSGDGHRAIADALAEGDAEGVKVAMHDHLNDVEQRMIEGLV